MTDADETRLRKRLADHLRQLDHDLALAAPTLSCPDPYGSWTEAQWDAAESMLAGVLAAVEPPDSDD